MIGVHMTGRGHKYRAQPVTIDGIRFASTREGRRYAELKLLAKAGEIRGLELQPQFECEVNGIVVCTYIADFSYLTRAGHRIFEDVKGVRTPLYKLKKKLTEALHAIEIVEI